jgi:AdoMet-dependent rRNA methyltransferase SPB1
LEVVDDRKYDSDHEEYDSDDYAQTLALGTMMLRRSKEKALVDASYNRYAWNDPNDLPEWFVDDENKHYRPQLPIPPALIAKMKEKMLALSAKPIAKVAEARARKQKRAKTKLAAAKKQAEALANNSDMSEAMKLKAISKALRGQDAKRPGKSYVVAKKGRGAKGAKGVKVVDKRMKSDKRSMERTEKKRSKGKQNGLVGSKKRRNHK